MIDKNQVENFLKVNGIPATAKDEEIRSILLSARWNNNEVDTALMVLKENQTSKETHVDTLHKVFQSDDRLSPAEISALLGVDVDITGENVNDIKAKRQRAERMQVQIALFLSVIIAAGSLVYVMYHEKAGLFHESVNVFNVD